MPRFLFVAAGVVPLLTAGCVSTVAGIVTAPIRVVGKAVDVVAPSQAKSDRKYGKKMRKEEEREGRERRAADKACKKDPTACGPYTGYRAGDTEPRN